MSGKLRLHIGDSNTNGIDNGTFANTTAYEQTDLERHRFTLGVMDLSIVSVGLLANILVLAVVLRHKFRQTAFGVHLAWLGLADIGVLLTHLCLTLLKHTWMTCRFFNFFNIFNLLLSSWTLVTLAAERVLAIYYPHKVRAWCTARRAFLFQMCLVGIIALVCTGVPLTSKIRVVGDWQFVLCYMHQTVSVFHPNVIYKLLLYSIVPFCLLVVLNSAIIVGLRRSDQFRTRHSTASSSSSSSSCTTSKTSSTLRDKGGSKGSTGSTSSSMCTTRTSVMLMVTCVMFVVTTLPVSSLTSGIVYSCDVTPATCDTIVARFAVLAEFLFRLQDFNHAVNFFVYFLSGSEFRAEILAMFGCRRTGHRGDSRARHLADCGSSKSGALSSGSGDASVPLRVTHGP